MVTAEEEEVEEEEWQITHTTSTKRVCILNWPNFNNSTSLLFNKLDRGERLSRYMVVLLDLMDNNPVLTVSALARTDHSVMDTVDFPPLNRLEYPPIHPLHLPILKMMMNRCLIPTLNYTNTRRSRTE